jgi:hypothetical protein
MTFRVLGQFVSVGLLLSPIAVAAPAAKPPVYAALAPDAGLTQTGKAHPLDLSSLNLPASPDARSMDVAYDIRVGGLTLASIDLKAVVDAGRYVATSFVATKGLADVFVSSDVQALATGSVQGKTIVPRTYNSDIRGGEKRQLVGLLFGDKGPIAVDSAPPYDTRFPVPEELKLSTIDPVSSILYVALGSSVQSSAPCGVNVPIFDGRRRYNLKLAFEGNDKVSAKGVYNGPALHCVAQYQRVAGFKPPKNGKKPTVVPPIDVWLAPMNGGEMLVPVRMEIDSDFGAVVARATRVKLAARSPQG